MASSHNPIFLPVLPYQCEVFAVRFSQKLCLLFSTNRSWLLFNFDILALTPNLLNESHIELYVEKYSLSSIKQELPNLATKISYLISITLMHRLSTKSAILVKISFLQGKTITPPKNIYNSYVPDHIFGLY